MKQPIIKIIDEIEARNDASRRLLAEPVSEGDVGAVSTAISVQQQEGRRLDAAWSDYLKAGEPAGESAAQACERIPAQIRLIRDTARQIASLISAILDGHEESGQFTNSARTIAEKQAEYIRDLRDLVGEL